MPLIDIYRGFLILRIIMELPCLSLARDDGEKKRATLKIRLLYS